MFVCGVCASFVCAYLLSCWLFVKQIRAVNCRPKCQSQQRQDATKQNMTKQSKAQSGKRNKMKQKRSNLARENFSEHYDTLLDSTKLLRHSTLLPSPSLATLSLCQLFSWPISRGVCSSGCHLGCHSINTLMHYSSLHSINKAIGSPTPHTPPAPFDLPALLVWPAQLFF